MTIKQKFTNADMQMIADARNKDSRGPWVDLYDVREVLRLAGFVVEEESTTPDDGRRRASEEER